MNNICRQVDDCVSKNKDKPVLRKLPTFDLPRTIHYAASRGLKVSDTMAYTFVLFSMVSMAGLGAVCVYYGALNTRKLI